MPFEEDAVTDEKAPPHAGYADWSKGLDLATWEAAVKKMLSTVKDVEEEQKDGTKVVRRRHETDPPDGPYPPRFRKPGALPLLVKPDEIAKGAKVESHEHSVPKEGDLDMTLYHTARHVVVEARRLHAKGIALKTPRVEGSFVVLEVVNVLT